MKRRRAKRRSVRATSSIDLWPLCTIMVRDLASALIELALLGWKKIREIFYCRKFAPNLYLVRIAGRWSHAS